MKKTKQPNITVEAFLSLCKYFLIVLVLTNGFWGLLHFGYFSKSFGGTSVEMTQDGTNNNQAINNG